MNLVADFLWNFLSVVYFFCPRHAACGILVPRPGIKPGPMAVKALSPNPWTTREFPHFVFKLLMTTQGYTNKQGEKILLVGINNLLFSYLAFMYLEHSFLSEGNPKSCLSQQWYSGILLSFLPCPLLSFVKGWSVDQQHQVSVGSLLEWRILSPTPNLEHQNLYLQNVPWEHTRNAHSYLRIIATGLVTALTRGLELSLLFHLCFKPNIISTFNSFCTQERGDFWRALQQVGWILLSCPIPSCMLWSVSSRQRVGYKWEVAMI